MLSKQLLFVALSGVVASGLSLLANYFGILKTDYWFISLLFFLLLNIILFLTYSFTRRSEDFTGILLGCLVGKLLLSLLCLVLARVFLEAPFLPFAIHFIVHFVIFTTFEIWYVLWLIRTR